MEFLVGEKKPWKTDFGRSAFPKFLVGGILGFDGKMRGVQGVPKLGEENSGIWSQILKFRSSTPNPKEKTQFLSQNPGIPKISIPNSQNCHPKSQQSQNSHPGFPEILVHNSQNSQPKFSEFPEFPEFLNSWNSQNFQIPKFPPQIPRIPKSL